MMISLTSRGITTNCMKWSYCYLQIGYQCLIKIVFTSRGTQPINFLVSRVSKIPLVIYILSHVILSCLVVPSGNRSTKRDINPWSKGAVVIVSARDGDKIYYHVCHASSTPSGGTTLWSGDDSSRTNASHNGEAQHVRSWEIRWPRSNRDHTTCDLSGELLYKWIIAFSNIIDIRISIHAYTHTLILHS